MKLAGAKQNTYSQFEELLQNQAVTEADSDLFVDEVNSWLIDLDPGSCTLNIKFELSCQHATADYAAEEVVQTEEQVYYDQGD